MNPIIGDRCVLCGRPARKPGEILCVFHDIQAQIALGYLRMIERTQRGQGGAYLQESGGNR
jgi:hypothetical protein